MRTLVEDKRDEYRKYRYVTAHADGRVCCAADALELMCDPCREAARHRAGLRPLPPVTRKDAGEVPDPPSLVEAIRADRARERGGLEVLRDGTVNEHGVPNAPRLAPARGR